MTIGINTERADSVCMFDTWDSLEAHNQFQADPRQGVIVGQAITLMAAEPARHNVLVVGA